MTDNAGLFAAISGSIKTGNFVLDCMIMTAIAGAVAWVASVIPLMRGYGEAFITKYWWRFYGYTHKISIPSQYIENSKASLVHGSDNNNIIDGVIAYLHRTGYTYNCRDHKAIIQTYGEYKDKLSEKLNARYMPIPCGYLKCEGMMLHISDDVTQSSASEDVVTTRKIELTVYTNNVGKTERWLEDRRVEDIKNSSRSDIPDEQWYYVMRTDRSDSKKILYDRYSFATRRTFDSIYFADKPVAISQISNFLNQRGEWDVRYQRPYKLVIFLHGPPGTGKTSFVKALAKTTQRNIVRVKVSVIADDTELIDVIHNTRLYTRGGNEWYGVPASNRIMLLEDLDADDCSEIIAPRSESKSPHAESKQPPGQQMPERKLERKTIDDVKDALDVLTKKSAVTQRGLLEVFDGVLELDGAIIVITTNHPEKFDPALIRPGRMDLNIHMGYVNQQIMIDTLLYSYPDIDRQQIPLVGDGINMTPAKLAEIIGQYRSSPGDALVAIRKYLELAGEAAR